MKRLSFLCCLCICVMGLILLNTRSAHSDGSEQLGTPSIAVEQGTDIVAGGVGVKFVQPSSISIDVPEGDIEQVLIYWQCLDRDNGDNDISVAGNNVVGTIIGGPTLFFSDVNSTAFRADITSLNIISNGPNTVEIDGMECFGGTGDSDNGAGIVVILDDGTSQCESGVLDGQDLAFINFEGDIQQTNPVTFNFTPDDVARTGEFCVLVGGVQALDNGFRGNDVVVTTDGIVTSFFDQLGIPPLASNDGSEWDTFCESVNVPSGASDVTIQPLSVDNTDPPEFDPDPASLQWVASTFVICTEDDPPGDDGCTPGFWCNKGFRSGQWTNTEFDPYDLIKDVFDVPFEEFADGSPTKYVANTKLKKAACNKWCSQIFEKWTYNKNKSKWWNYISKYKWWISQYKEKKKCFKRPNNEIDGAAEILLRAAVAAILNASHPDINYPREVSDIIADVNEALVSSDREDLINLAKSLDEDNNLGCPIGSDHKHHYYKH